MTIVSGCVQEGQGLGVGVYVSLGSCTCLCVAFPVFLGVSCCECVTCVCYVGVISMCLGVRVPVISQNLFFGTEDL